MPCQLCTGKCCERLRSLPCAGSPGRSASLLSICLRAPRARAEIPKAVSKRGVTLQVKAFSCSSARVWGPARRGFTDPNKGGITIPPVQHSHTHPHLHTMPKESSPPAAEELPLPGTVSYICKLNWSPRGSNKLERAFLPWPHPCRVLPQGSVIPCAGISGVRRDARPIWS